MLKKLLKEFGNFLIRQKCRDLGKSLETFWAGKAAHGSSTAGLEPIHAQHPPHVDSQTTAAHARTEVDKTGECDLSSARIAPTNGSEQP